MIYSRALLLVRVLQWRVLVLINKSTFGKDDGELKTSLANASKFAASLQQVHVMTLGGVIVGAVYYLAKDLGIRNTRLEEGLKRLDEKQESETVRGANDKQMQLEYKCKITRLKAESAMLRVFTGNEHHVAIEQALEKAILGEGGGEGGEGGGAKAMEKAMSFPYRALQYPNPTTTP